MFLLLFATFIFIFAIFLFGQDYHTKTKRLPPGPYRFPILGSIPQILMADPSFPHKAFTKLSKKYGDLMSVGMGVHYMVIVSSYNHIKEIFTRIEATSRFPFPFVEDRNFGKENMGIIFTDNLEIKNYTMKKMKDLGMRAKTFLDPLLQQEASELIQVISQKIDADGIWQVDTLDLSVSTLNISWAFMSGSRLSLDNPKLVEAVKGNEQVLDAIGMKNKYTALPFLKHWFPKWSGHVDHMRAFTHLQDILKEMVNDMKQNAPSENFIQNFLSEIENSNEDNKHKFNEEQLIVALSDVFLAGSETASNTLNWLLLYLSRHPEIQENVYEEIVRVIGQNGLIMLAHENKMPYTKAVIYETMRCVNFVPLSVPRVATKDIEIGGYLIPKGSGLTYNLDPVFQDKDYWKDPETFRPARFMEFDEHGVLTGLKGTERLALFGVGKRLCPGDTLGMNTIFFFLVALLQEFRFSVVPGKIPSFYPIFSISIRPQAYCLKLERRQ